MIIDTDQIERLLSDRSISAYQIGKATGITRSTIGDYRNGKADVGNMSLKRAAALQRFATEVYRNEGKKE